MFIYFTAKKLREHTAKAKDGKQDRLATAAVAAASPRPLNSGEVIDLSEIE